MSVSIEKLPCLSCQRGDICLHREEFTAFMKHSDEIMVKAGVTDESGDHIDTFTDVTVNIQFRYLDGPGLKALFEGLGFNEVGYCCSVPQSRCPITRWYAKGYNGEPLLTHDRNVAFFTCGGPHSGWRPPLTSTSVANKCGTCQYAGSVNKATYMDIAGTPFSTVSNRPVQTTTGSKLNLHTMDFPPEVMSGYEVDKKLTEEFHEVVAENDEIIIYLHYTKATNIPSISGMSDAQLAAQGKLRRFGVLFGGCAYNYPEKVDPDYVYPKVTNIAITCNTTRVDYNIVTAAQYALEFTRRPDDGSTGALVDWYHQPVKLTETTSSRETYATPRPGDSAARFANLVENDVVAVTVEHDPKYEIADQQMFIVYDVAIRVTKISERVDVLYFILGKKDIEIPLMYKKRGMPLVAITGMGQAGFKYHTITVDCICQGKYANAKVPVKAPYDSDDIHFPPTSALYDSYPSVLCGWVEDVADWANGHGMAHAVAYPYPNRSHIRKLNFAPTAATAHTASEYPDTLYPILRTDVENLREQLIDAMNTFSDITGERIPANLTGMNVDSITKKGEDHPVYPVYKMQRMSMDYNYRHDLKDQIVDHIKEAFKDTPVAVKQVLIPHADAKLSILETRMPLDDKGLSTLSSPDTLTYVEAKFFESQVEMFEPEALPTYDLDHFQLSPGMNHFILMATPIQQGGYDLQFPVSAFIEVEMEIRKTMLYLEAGYNGEKEMVMFPEDGFQIDDFCWIELRGKSEEDDVNFEIVDGIATLIGKDAPFFELDPQISLQWVHQIKTNIILDDRIYDVIQKEFRHGTLAEFDLVDEEMLATCKIIEVAHKTKSDGEESVEILVMRDPNTDRLMKSSIIEGLSCVIQLHNCDSVTVENVHMVWNAVKNATINVYLKSIPPEEPNECKRCRGFIDTRDKYWLTWTPTCNEYVPNA